MNDNAIPMLEEITAPSSVDAADATDFLAVVELNNAVCLLESGVPDLASTPQEMLAQWRDETDRVQRYFVAREGGQIVGAGVFEYATAEPTSTNLDILLLPEQWGRGIEDALLELAERETRALGRRVLQAWTLHRPGTGAELLTPATGWGAVPETPHARALLAHGFTFEQVERNSAFDLQAPMDAIEGAYDAALAAAGPDYRVVAWTVPTPPEWRDGYAWALSRMSTDAPSGALEVDEETWDAERIVRRDARFAAGGQTVSVVGVEHVPSGTIAAFNELVIGADPTEATHQYCTLVLKEHRGHRLGMLVKCANLLRWREVAPQSPRVTTFNAEENRPMLDINEALGFVPVSYAGAWQRKLD